MNNTVQGEISFDPQKGDAKKVKPLAVRMRPRTLSEIKGQERILGEDCLLPRLVKSGNISSILLYGPPGCGKTSLAEVIANEINAKCVRVNAVLSNVAELKDILKFARYEENIRTLLFIDEIHRFNKAQQDLLLPDVEEGNITLIGATTHNPGFYIIPALLSRSHLFRLEPLTEPSIVDVLKSAVADADRGLATHKSNVTDSALSGIAQLSGGDVRRALNALETIVLSQPMGSEITDEVVKVYAEERHIRYDKNEDEHYDTVSAFIKSIRGSNPDAALYWLAKMIEGGEDPRFIARRLVILASEDVGLADSRGLPLAMATFEACEKIGMPECRINLAHATVFLACAPKSNTAYMGLINAQQEIKKGKHQDVPLWLRDGSKKVSKDLDYGKGYLYSHDYPENISGQEYMLDPKQFFFPKDSGAEASLAERLTHWKALKGNKSSK